MSGRGRQGKDVPNVPGSSGPSPHELSSLVIQTDRSEIVRRDKEAGSDMVESIWGRLNPSEMGSRAGREAAPVSGKKSANVLGLRSQTSSAAAFIGDADDSSVQFIYKPKSRETQAALEHLLTFLQHEADFMDQPASVVRSAADEVLAILKSQNDSWKDLDRKMRIEEALGLAIDTISAEKYAQLVSLARRINDYPMSAGEIQSGDEEEDLGGIAVVFDEDEDGEGADDGFGTAANLVEDEEQAAEDEAELERSLPIPRLVKTDTVVEDKILDISSLAFPEGGHVMTNKKCVLPENAFKVAKKGYEEYHVPAPEAKPLEAHERLVPIASLPKWAQPAFAGFTSLNRIQSRLAPVALEDDQNVLLCAPTGAGKTNVALLTMLHEIGKHLKSDSASDVALDEFKIVYIAPMKALVQEMVRNFTSRLQPFGMSVAELTGDASMTRAQLASTQVIVTTPEKWDVVTRKNTDASSFTRLVKLIIIDEIHLLHDDRGPVLESIVTRTLRQSEQTQEFVRLVGLSATLPNYVDVARFLRVNPAEGLFFFDSSFRPCPLSQQFIGVTEKKPLKALALMNEICYEKALEDVQAKNQVLVFVHSRKETAKCAKAIRDLAIQNETIGKFLPSDAAKSVLAEAVEATRNAELKDILPYGFAIHHAGMTRADRIAVEEMFAAGNLQVLVSTATLAWGVNLPAHTVIIRGTRVYSPERGCWAELNAQDVLQMLGRAGRPQYDTFGSGIIITAHSELQYYMSLMNSQLPIESQLMRKLVDNLNAEVVLNMVRNVEDGVNWLGYTFLYLRMMQIPNAYGVDWDTAESDAKLRNFRQRLIHSAATVLERANMVKYDRRTGQIQSTELGRIASYYYLTHQSMLVYAQTLRPTMDEIDLFRLFAMSSEFKMIPIRAEEKIELNSLAERIPVPIKEVATEDPLAKVNILLQAYISQLNLEGFALVSDMVYITQSAGRLWRAIFEICLRRGWARVARKALDICKMVEHRQWLSHSPLRQLPQVPSELVRRIERKDFAFERLFDLNPAELGELVRSPKQGKLLFDALQNFPRVSMLANILPLTRSLLRIELSITPEFDWNEESTSYTEPFWLTVEDVDQEHVLYSDSFVLRRNQCRRGEALYVTVNVPLLNPLPPLYFVRLSSDRWLHCEARLPISLMKLKLPSECPPPTALLDLPPLTPEAAFTKYPELASQVFGYVEAFNAIHTQVFPAMYRSDESVLIGAPAGSDALVAAEFAICRHALTRASTKVVYISPVREVATLVHARWSEKFASLLPKPVVLLTGEVAADLKLLDACSIAITEPRHWELLSRRWKQRKAVQAVGLVIADMLHYVGKPEIGPQYEVALSRTRYISSQLEEASEGDHKIRIVALSEPLANGNDVADWLGCSPAAVFNFDASARPTPLRIHLQSFLFDDTASNNKSLLNAMTRPAFLSILEAFDANEPGSPTALVYVDNRKQARALAVDLMTLSMAESARRVHGSPDLPDDYSLFCRGSPFEDAFETGESSLSALLPHGIGYYHESLSAKDKSLVQESFASGRLQVVVVSRSSLWDWQVPAPLVVILGTHTYEGRERRFIEYQVSDIFCMLGRAQGSGVASALILTTNAMKPFYRQVLYESLPLESYLDQSLHDPFNAEITTRVITSKQDAIDYLTWTFLYRRLPLNPHYYSLASASHRHISDHLSELVESSLNALQEAKCIQIIDDMYCEPLNLGMIAAYYSIHYATIEMMAVSLQANTRLRGILQVIAAAAEFDWLVPVRMDEEAILAALHAQCPVRLGAASLKFHDPHVKVAILLQCHFSRINLPGELKGDLEVILGRVVPLCYALIDVLSSHGWLAPALAAMEFCQMCVQAVWDSDSPLRQLPHFDSDGIKAAQEEFACEGITDFVELDDRKKLQLLKGLSPRAIADIANFSNDYPSDLEVALLTGEQITAAPGADVTLSVALSLERDEDAGQVKFTHFPNAKEVAWWVVAGNPTDRTILAIKRVTIPAAQGSRQVDLDFTAPELQQTTSMSLKVYVLCDSYLGCDQELDFSLLIE